MALLIVKQRGLETKSFPLTVGILTVGRATENDVVLSNRYTSGRHCEIRWEGGQWALQDLNSTNGLFVNGAKVTSKVLEDGDRILAGGALLIFIADEGALRLDSLIPRLQSGTSGDREVAATLLGHLGAASAAGPLLEALRHDTDGKVKAAAAEALGLLGNPEAVKALIAFFDTHDIALRNAVVRAIVRIADEEAVDDVASFLTHSDKKVRILAAYTLGQIHFPRASKKLKHVLQDESYEVREAAVKALGDLGDPQSVDILLQIASEPERYSLVWIIDSLGKIADSRALPVLVVNAVNAHSVEVREAAADALGNLRTKEAVPTLISLLEDQDARVRHSAATSLEKLRKYVERERKLSSLGGQPNETMEISAVDEGTIRAVPVGSSFGEDRVAWERWWSAHKSTGR